MTRSVSNSELADWRTCRLRWWLRNVRELGVPEPEESAAQTGTLVHKLIEAHLGHEDPMLVMQAKAQERGFLRTDQVVLDTFKAWQQEWERLYAGVTIHALEQTLTANVDKAVSISGVVDVIGQRDGMAMVIDHKTTGLPLSFWGHDNEMLVRHQLMLYDWLRSRLMAGAGSYAEPSIVAAHVISTTGQRVKVLEWIISPDARESFGANLIHQVGEVAQAAEIWASGNIDPTDELYRRLMNIGRHCGTCDYRPLCNSILTGQENTENVARMTLVEVPRLAYRAR